jgi:hypothetical protein
LNSPVLAEDLQRSDQNVVYAQRQDLSTGRERPIPQQKSNNRSYAMEESSSNSQYTEIDSVGQDSSANASRSPVAGDLRYLPYDASLSNLGNHVSVYPIDTILFKHANNL